MKIQVTKVSGFSERSVVVPKNVPSYTNLQVWGTVLVDQTSTIYVCDATKKKKEEISRPFV